MKIVIFANGELDDVVFSRQVAQNADYIVCADGGIRHAALLDIVPDCLLGDFDSADPNLLKFYRGLDVEIVRFSTHKDATDLELAIKHSLEKNPVEITILGGFGGRADHFLGNIHALIPADNAGVSAILLSKNASARLISSSCVFQKQLHSQLSLIPLTTTVTGIKTVGLKYNLHSETLQIGTSRGISNVIIADTATVCVSGGLLLAICTKL